MKKIIAAFDSLSLSESTLEYAIYLAKQYDAHIVGVFLRESTQIGYAVYATVVQQTSSAKNIFDEISLADKKSMTESIASFESICTKNKVSYNVHKDNKNALDELIHETTFADLLVIDAWETFSYIENSMPGWFIKNVLHHAQCPVLVVPKKFIPINKLMLLYDGSASSVHAIKMFNYILPEMTAQPATLLCSKHDSFSMHLPDNKLIKEWVKRHFKKPRYEVLKGGEKGITTILANEKPGVLVVAGSYHRSSLSMWLHKSLADLLLKETRLPLFISHI